MTGSCWGFLGIYLNYCKYSIDEILDQLSDQLDISVSLSTVYRTLKLLGITSKKVCLFCCIKLNC